MILLKNSAGRGVMPIMFRIVQFLLKFIAAGFRSRLSLQLEVAALRHQLSLYQARSTEIVEFPCAAGLHHYYLPKAA